MKYYVNSGTKIGKTFDAKTDTEAVAYAEGYGYAKGWKDVNVYCASTHELVVRGIPSRDPETYEPVSPVFVECSKLLLRGC